MPMGMPQEQPKESKNFEKQPNFYVHISKSNL